MLNRRFRRPARILLSCARFRRRLGLAAATRLRRGLSVRCPFLGLVGALCLVAAACVGQQDKLADTGPQASSPTAAEEQEADAGGTDEDGGSDGSGGTDGAGVTASSSTADDSEAVQAISVDIVKVFFPTSAADTHSTVDFFTVINRATFPRIQACMREAGFEYSPPGGSSDDPGHWADFPDLDKLEEFGWYGDQGHDAPDSEPAVDPSEPLAGIPQELHAQLEAELRACTELHYAPRNRITDAARVLEHQWWNELASIDSAPEVVEQFRIWRECMVDGGMPVRRGDDPSATESVSSFDTARYRELSAQSRAAAREYEMAAAKLYVSCMRPVEEVRQPLRDAARRQFLEDNSEEVRAIQELANQLLRDLEQAQ